MRSEPEISIPWLPITSQTCPPSCQGRLVFCTDVSRSVPLWIASGRFFPPGFEITGLRHFEGDNEVISIVEWKSQKVSESKLSVLFRFKDDKIYEER